MNDEDNKNLGEELAAAFEADMDVTENPVTPAVDDAANPDDSATPPAPNGEEPKKDDSEDPDKKNEEPETPPADPTNSEKKDPETPETPETPPAEDEPKPLTEESVMRLLNEARAEERNSGQELRNAYNDVMDAYYPDGLSNILETPDGKKLRTPQDVVDASNGEMSHEEAAQWLMNEQYKLDNSIRDIQTQAAKIAETTVTFKRDATAALQKYEPLFKAYPSLQPKVFDLMMKQVRADEKKGVILQAPDVMELYDTYLEPYQRAYEYSTNKPATNPTPPAGDTPPAPATPGQSDRLDEGADGGQSPVDDPEDFAQQVEKELAKPF